MLVNRLFINYFLLAVALIILAIGAALSFINHDFFVNRFVVEDGPTEWLTFYILLASAVLCFKRWVQSDAKQPKSYRMMLFVLFMFFIFGAGEEVSWGQRIFDVESSEFFLEHNAQNETNFHNLMVGDVKLNKLIFGTGFAIIFFFYLAVFTPLYHKKPAVQRWLDSFAVPIPRAEQIVCFLTLLIVVEVVMTSSKRGEMTECVGALLVFATLLNPLNKHVFSARA